MTSIGFGLNIPSKSGSKKSGISAGPPSRKPIARKPPPGFFGAGDPDDDDDKKANESDGEPSSGVFSKSSKASKSKRDPTKPPSKPPTPSAAANARSSVNADLASHIAHSTSQAISAEAEASSIDPSIYAYDSVFDSMKSATSLRNGGNSANLEDPSTRKPKYMESLLAAAETRKRDQLRAKERMLQREREAEGEEFADKEKFVTEAYKAQQEEMRKLEEEEAKREEEERKKSRGLTGLYRNLLDRTEEKHVAAVAASKNVDVSDKIKDGDDDTVKAKEEREREKTEAKKQLPSHVEINDEGLVVDKRQLLTGGLNVLTSRSSSRRVAASTQNASSSTAPRGYQGKNRVELDRRARQTRMLEEQLEATQKRAREEEEAKAKEFVERQVKKTKSEGEVLGAKERYLARKKAKEEEERKAKAGGGE